MTPFLFQLATTEAATFADAPVGKRRLLRVQIFPISDAPIAHPSGDLRFDRAFADRVVANFASYPGKVPADYDHGTEKGSGSPDSGIAAGWVDRVLIEGSAVVAYVDPTARAVALVEAGEYKFASPTVHFDWTNPQTGAAQGPTLLSVALTNRPFLRGMAPLEMATLRDANASPARKAESMPETTPETPAPAIESIALADHTAQVQTLRDEIATLADRATKAEATVLALRDEIDAGKAKADVDAAEAAGKIVPASRAKMLELRRMNPALFSDLVATLPVAVKLGAATGIDAPSAPPVETLEGKGARLVELADALAKEHGLDPMGAMRLARQSHPDLADGF